MVIPSGQPEPAGTYLVTWNGHGDAMALHRILADGSLEKANTVTYGTWGHPTIDGSHPNSANGSQPYGDLGFRFLYVGEFDVQWDRELGLDLYYMHARHYSPATGRFIQPDPDRSEANLYAYAANSPVTEIDPDGTCFIVCVLVGAVVDTAVYLATTDSSDWNVGDAAGAVVSGAVESAVNPLAKIGKVTKLANAAQKVYSKFSKAGRATKRFATSTTRAVKRFADGGHTVYYAGRKAGPSYVGITNNFARRSSQHMAKSGRSINQYGEFRKVNRFDAHAIEQALIKKHGLGRNGGRLQNRVNSVSRADPLYRLYVWRGERLLGRHGL